MIQPSIVYRYLLSSILLSVVFGTVSCSLFKPSALHDATIQHPSEEKILFLVFRMTGDTLLHNTRLELLQTTITDGAFKQNKLEQPPSPNYLIIEVAANNKNSFKTFAEHPLVRRAEYDAGNELKSKIIHLSEGDFFVRLPIKGNNNKVKITEILESGRRTVLFNNPILSK